MIPTDESDLLTDAWRQVRACLDLTLGDPGRLLVVVGDPVHLDGLGMTDLAHHHVVVTRPLRDGFRTEFELPFADASFDTIVVSGVFERLSARRRGTVAAELARVCSGTVAVVAPVGPPFAPEPRFWRPQRTGVAPMMRWRVGGSSPREVRLCGRLWASSTWEREPSIGVVGPDRSHAVAVFTLGATGARWSWRWYGRRSRRSTAQVDLRNALQVALARGRDRHWMRWRLLDGTAGLDGVSASGEHPGRVAIELPGRVAVSAIDVVYRRLGDQHSPAPTVQAEVDGLSIGWRVAHASTGGDGADHVCFEPVGSALREVAMTQFVVTVPPHTTVVTIDCAIGVGGVTDLGVEVRPGPNLTLLADGPVRLSWHLESDRSGWVPTGGGVLRVAGRPQPIRLWPEGSPVAFEPSFVEPYPWDLVHMFQSVGGFDLPAPWEPIGADTAPAPSGNPLRRVLVVAHMFPVPFNPVSGAFVFESAKAIVDVGDVAVRAVCPVPFWGPGRRQVRARRAARAVYAAAVEQARRCVYRLDGVEVQYVPYYVPKHWHRHGDAVASAVGALRPEIERFDPQLVHAHSGYLDGWAASRVASDIGVPLVITEHTGPLERLFDDPRIARKIRAAYRVSSEVLGVSTFQAAEIRRLVPEVRAKVSVQFNGYDAATYAPGGPTLHPAPTLIYVGYITPGKGLDVLVRAFGEVVAGLPGSRLIVAGDVADATTMADVLALVRSHRVEDRVEFVGGCTRAQVAELMHRADVLVLPSEGETFGCVLVEALGSGRMVVATSCGGPEDIARDEPAVRLVPIGDASAVALAVEQLWHARLDPALRPEAIAHRAAQRFDYRTIADDLVARYDRLIAGTSRRTKGAS